MVDLGYPDSNELLLMTGAQDAQRGRKEDEMWAEGLDVLRERVISKTLSN